MSFQERLAKPNGFISLFLLQECGEQTIVTPIGDFQLFFQQLNGEPRTLEFFESSALQVQFLVVDLKTFCKFLQ